MTEQEIMMVEDDVRETQRKRADSGIEIVERLEQLEERVAFLERENGQLLSEVNYLMGQIAEVSVGGR